MPILHYACSICGTIYKTEQEAVHCESKGREEPKFNVGEFITVDQEDYGTFGWYDGDPNWVTSKPRGLHPHDGPQYSLIYVITAITQYGHRLKYHLATKGMSGKQGYRSGWNTIDGGRGQYVLPITWLDGNDLLGKTFDHLVA